MYIYKIMKFNVTSSQAVQRSVLASSLTVSVFQECSDLEVRRFLARSPYRKLCSTLVASGLDLHLPMHEALLFRTL